MLTLCLVHLPSTAVLADAQPDIEQLNLKRWISRMWEPVTALGGLLSHDQREDVVIVLHRRGAILDEVVLTIGSRGLGIFSLDAKWKYRRATILEGLLPCVQCLGTVTCDPHVVPFEIDIADRQLTMSWIGNADGFVSVRLVIAWDAKEQAFGLIADEVVRADRRGAITSRRTRGYRTGRAETDGQVTEFPLHFMPAERIWAEGLDHNSAHLIQSRRRRSIEKHGLARANPHGPADLWRICNQGRMGTR